MACDDGSVGCRNGCGYARVTKWTTLTANVVLYVTPQHLAGNGVDRGNTGTRRLGIKPFAVAGIVHIIDGYVYGRAVSSHTKVNAALNAAAPQFDLPQFVLPCLPIKGKDPAVFLPGNDDGLAFANINQQRTRSLIVIRPILFRAVGVVGHHAGNIPRVTGKGLPAP